MTLQALRGLFILMMAAIGWFFLTTEPSALGPYLANRAWLLLTVTLVLGVLVVCVDIAAPRGKLQAFSGVFFGLLVGLVLAFAFSFMVPFLVDLFVASPNSAQRNPLVSFLNLLIGAVCCYFAISFILQTRDDFRFVIPYVEFRKDTRGTSPILLDTGVMIDGRIRELVRSPLFETRLIVPRFVLGELQALADSAERVKRERGRRGLEVLEDLRGGGRDVVVYEPHERRAAGGVDDQLVRLAQKLRARLMTADAPLARVAELEGVPVIQLHDLAEALRPATLPGDAVEISLVKPGDQTGQGVGYLPDGSMVVVEHADGEVGRTVKAVITNTRRTSAGTLAFARLADGPGAGDSDLAMRLPRRRKKPA